MAWLDRLLSLLLAFVLGRQQKRVEDAENDAKAWANKPTTIVLAVKRLRDEAKRRS